MFEESRKCAALPAVGGEGVGGGQTWTVMEEVTFELSLLEECEIQQAKSTGSGNSLYKASRYERLKSQEQQVFGVSGGPGAFSRKMKLEGPAAASQ